MSSICQTTFVMISALLMKWVVILMSSKCHKSWSTYVCLMFWDLFHSKDCTRRSEFAGVVRSTSTRTTQTSSCTTGAAAGSLASRLGWVGTDSHPVFLLMIFYQPGVWRMALRQVSLHLHSRPAWGWLVFVALPLKSLQEQRYSGDLLFYWSGNLEYDQRPGIARRPQPSCRPNVPRGICSQVYFISTILFLYIMFRNRILDDT